MLRGGPRAASLLLVGAALLAVALLGTGLALNATARLRAAASLVLVASRAPATTTTTPVPSSSPFVPKKQAPPVDLDDATAASAVGLSDDVDKSGAEGQESGPGEPAQSEGGARRAVRPYNCSHKFAKPGSLPKFIVAGVHKGGSTSLFNYLVQHGSVRPAVCKEIHFFDSESEYERGADRYRRYFPDLSLAPSDKITGEGSPSYVRHPLVPGRLRKMAPGAKVIVSLREPADRFESSWVGMVDRNMAPMGHMRCDAAWNASVAKWSSCVSRASAAACSESLHDNFVSRSVYVHQLRRWLKHGYGPHDLLVIQSEHMFHHRTDTMQRVAAFLGLRPFTPAELASFEKSSKGSSHMEEPIAHECDQVKPVMVDFFRSSNDELKAFLRHEFPSTLTQFWDWERWR